MNLQVLSTIIRYHTRSIDREVPALGMIEDTGEERRREERGNKEEVGGDRRY